MRLQGSRRVGGFAALAAVAVLALAGADAPRAVKKKAEGKPPKSEETVSDLADITSRTETKLEGVGLVVGLDNTGVDPPPSSWRNKLIEEMQKAQVPNANGLLKDPRVSLVVVKLTVPAGVTPADRLDVTLELPPASGTRSLAGGTLLTARLREVRAMGGAVKEGPEAAVAQGPVMIGSPEAPNDLKVGRVLGGGRVRKEVPFQVILRDTRKSFRNAKIVEDAINQRFPLTDGVKQKGAATAKTDQILVLKVPPVYHQNQDRFFRVVKLLSVVDAPAFRESRTRAWGRELLDPAKAGVAALRLEGLGVTAAETLRGGLENTSPQVRFLAAEALAYLNDPAGADALADTAIKLPEFRAYALAALSAMDQPVSHAKLRQLMDVPDVEVRYGAFNALRTLAADDELLGRVRVLNEPEGPAEDPDDSMAVAIASASRKRPRRDDPFKLYVVESEGPPMVHVARSRRCEVVVFGRGVKLLPPVVLGTGALLLNASDGDERIEISKIVPSRGGDADEKVYSALDLADVIRQAANLGASYPELVTILQAAERQRNLPGPLVVDAVPGASPEYVKAAIFGVDKTAKKDDALSRTKLDEKTTPRRFSLFDRFRRRDKGDDKGGGAAPEGDDRAAPSK